MSSSHRQNDRQVVHPQKGKPDRRSHGSHGPSAAVCCVDSSPTTTRLNQRHVLVEGPSIWSLTDRLCHGILQMGYVGTQVQCEVWVRCQRWGLRYDHGLISCVCVCRAFSPHKRDKQIDYALLMAKDGDELRQWFDARIKQRHTATRQWHQRAWND